MIPHDTQPAALTDGPGTRRTARHLSLRAVCVMALAALAAGCSSAFVEKRPMSWQVMLVQADQVGNCASKGGVRVTAAAYVLWFKRNDEDVEANLLQLARNGAVDAGGDTIVRGESPYPGTRNFAIYRCGP